MNLWPRTPQLHHQPQHGGGGSYTNYGTGGYSYTPKKSPGFIIVLDEKNDTVFTKEVPGSDDDWFAVAETVFPTQLIQLGTDEKPDVRTVIQIPAKYVEFTEGTIDFYACTYNATQDYLAAQHGKKLDESDRKWLARHPYATDEGLPQEYMASALHELVEPYGLGVSRVRFKAGFLGGAEAMKWKTVLGCNPYAITDHRTTNAEAIERMQKEGWPEQAIPTLEKANEMWRCEFGPEPLRPCVIGEVGVSGQQTGNQHGHATYLPPRAGNGNWKVSLQFAPTRELVYYVPPVPTPYKPRRGKLTLVYSNIKRPDGKPVAVLAGSNRYRSPEEAAHSGGVFRESQGVTSGTQAPQSGTQGAKAPGKGRPEATVICTACTFAKPVSQMQIGMQMCDTCYYTKAWVGLMCPKCMTRFDNYPPEYEPDLGTADDPKFQCPNHECMESIELPNDTQGNLVRTAIRQYDLTESDRLQAQLGLSGGSTAQSLAQLPPGSPPVAPGTVYPGEEDEDWQWMQ
jgi:hypothetical protein